MFCHTVLRSAIFGNKYQAEDWLTLCFPVRWMGRMAPRLPCYHWKDLAVQCLQHSLKLLLWAKRVQPAESRHWQCWDSEATWKFNNINVPSLKCRAKWEHERCGILEEMSLQWCIERCGVRYKLWSWLTPTDLHWWFAAYLLCMDTRNNQSILECNAHANASSLLFWSWEVSWSTLIGFVCKSILGNS